METTTMIKKFTIAALVGMLLIGTQAHTAVADITDTIIQEFLATKDQAFSSTLTTNNKQLLFNVSRTIIFTGVDGLAAGDIRDRGFNADCIATLPLNLAAFNTWVNAAENHCVRLVTGTKSALEKFIELHNFMKPLLEKAVTARATYLATHPNLFAINTARTAFAGTDPITARYQQLITLHGTQELRTATGQIITFKDFIFARVAKLNLTAKASSTMASVTKAIGTVLAAGGVYKLGSGMLAAIQMFPEETLALKAAVYGSCTIATLAYAYFMFKSPTVTAKLFSLDV